jgi:hypothetical protein
MKNRNTVQLPLMHCSLKDAKKSSQYLSDRLYNLLNRFNYAGSWDAFVIENEMQRR